MLQTIFSDANHRPTYKQAFLKPENVKPALQLISAPWSRRDLSRNVKAAHSNGLNLPHPLHPAGCARTMLSWTLVVGIPPTLLRKLVSIKHPRIFYSQSHPLWVSTWDLSPFTQRWISRFQVYMQTALASYLNRQLLTYCRGDNSNLCFWSGCSPSAE